MTVLELIKSSLRGIGAIASSETPSSDAVSDAVELLNMLLEEWHNEGLVAQSERQSFAVSEDTYEYTIGDGLTWDGNAPLKIISAYIALDGNDYSLKIIGEDEYMNIPVKDESGVPSRIYYERSGSTGTVFLHSSPEDDYTITMLSLKAFTAYSAGSVGTTINLPSGYLSALKYALCVEIAPEYETTPSDWILKRANETLAAIMRTNLKKPKPMTFDPLFSNSYGRYNAVSDTYS